MSTTDTIPKAAASHTPAPWVVAQNSGGPAYVAALTDHGGRIATVSDNPNDQRIAVCNARLIAAAPTLLEALSEMMACHKLREIKGEALTPLQLEAAKLARQAIVIATAQ